MHDEAGPRTLSGPEATAAKTALRAAMASRLRGLSAEDRKRRTEAATEALALFAAAHVAAGEPIGLYAATPTELSTSPIVGLLRDRYPLAFPRVDGNRIQFHLGDLDRLVAHSSFVREPYASAPVVVPRLMVIPGRAFDLTGIRLGRGAGFYDRTLAHISAETLLVGFCFAWQVVDQLPRAAHDRWVSWLVTDEGEPQQCRTPAPFPQDSSTPHPPRDQPRRSPHVPEQ